MEYWKIFETLITQLPVIGALIVFLMFYLHYVAKREERREQWFTQTMAEKDAIYRESLEKAWNVHRGVCNKIFDGLKAMEAAILNCTHVNLVHDIRHRQRGDALPISDQMESHDLEHVFPDDNPSSIVSNFPAGHTERNET
jgi:hypothetical protein